MKVLVTGGAGFVGSHVVDLLVARGHEVVVLDNLDPQVHGPDAAAPTNIEGHLRLGGIRFLRGDVSDPDAVESACAGVDGVVHLAAAVGVGQSMYQPLYYVRTNDLGTGVLLQQLLARGGDLKRLVVASSMSLYGEGAYRCTACGSDRAAPRTEARLATQRFEVPCADCGRDMEPMPTPESKAADVSSIYAATKKHQEDLFTAFGRAYRVPTFALRFFNVFGPRQSLSNPYTGVAAIFLSRLLAGRPPLVFEDGAQARDFVDVRDVARAVATSVDHEAAGVHVLNIGTGRRTSINDVAATLANALGVEVGAQRLGRFRAGDIRHCYADPSLAERVLGFRAEHTLASGIGPLVEWCRGAPTRDLLDQSLGELERQGLVR